MRGFRRRRRLWRDKAGGGVPLAFLFAVALAHPVVYSHFRILQGKKRKLHKKVWKKMRRFRRRRWLWRDKAGGGVPPAFLFAVALAHPVVYSYFRILQGKKRKLYEKVWKKMRGFRRRRRLWRDKAGGEEKNLSSKGFFFYPCNKSVIFYNTANFFMQKSSLRLQQVIFFIIRYAK